MAEMYVVRSELLSPVACTESLFPSWFQAFFTLARDIMTKLNRKMVGFPLCLVVVQGSAKHSQNLCSLLTLSVSPGKEKGSLSSIPAQAK